MNPALAFANAQTQDRSAPLARPALVMALLAAHLLAVWGLSKVDSVRQAAARMVPLRVALIESPPPPAPPPPPQPLAPRTALPPTPPPIAVPAVAMAAIVVAPPAAEYVPPVAVVPAASTAIRAVPAPSPPQKTIAATAVQYLEPPAPVYPASARRLGESGRVAVRVEIDTQGRARQVHIAHSSGSSRLDAAALAAVRAARFRPYTENGLPQVVWTTVPIDFELES